VSTAHFRRVAVYLAMLTMASLAGRDCSEWGARSDKRPRVGSMEVSIDAGHDPTPRQCQRIALLHRGSGLPKRNGENDAYGKPRSGSERLIFLMAPRKRGHGIPTDPPSNCKPPAPKGAPSARSATVWKRTTKDEPRPPWGLRISPNGVAGCRRKFHFFLTGR